MYKKYLHKFILWISNGGILGGAAGMMLTCVHSGGGGVWYRPLTGQWRSSTQSTTTSHPRIDFNRQQHAAATSPLFRINSDVSFDR